MVNKTKELNVKLIILNVFLLMVVLAISIIGLNVEHTREEEFGVDYYIAQLEDIAAGTGYSKGAELTFSKRENLETEQGRYQEVMKYLNDTEVSESEYVKIKELQEQYRKAQELEDNDDLYKYVFIITLLFVLVSILMFLTVIRYTLRLVD